MGRYSDGTTASKQHVSAEGCLFAKHHFLLNGLGWGGMPLHAVRQDLEKGRLVVLPIEDVPPRGLPLSMSAVWQTKSPPGPAGRWFIERLKQIPIANGGLQKSRAASKKRRRRKATDLSDQLRAVGTGERGNVTPK
jgi:LysR substrate binding domain